MKISHMKKDELFEGFYLIKSADLRQTRAGKNYLAFTFQDDSGEIDGKLWDAQPHNIEAFTAGKVVHMKGRREVYNNGSIIFVVGKSTIDIMEPILCRKKVP